MQVQIDLTKCEEKTYVDKNNHYIIDKMLFTKSGEMVIVDHTEITHSQATDNRVETQAKVDAFGSAGAVEYVQLKTAEAQAELTKAIAIEAAMSVSIEKIR